MAELTAADVSTFTGGRLANDGGSGEVTRMLNAALTVARSQVGWHVSPVRTGDVVVLDGPGSSILDLPTLKLVTLTSVVEDGVTLDVTKIKASANPTSSEPLPVRLRKTTSPYWWSCNYQAVAVTMTHGYTETEAADWRQAILTMVDQMSRLPTGSSGRSDADLSVKKVDDVQYEWGAYTAMAEQVLFSVESILCGYELAPVYFA